MNEEQLRPIVSLLRKHEFSNVTNSNKLFLLNNLCTILHNSGISGQWSLIWCMRWVPIVLVDAKGSTLANPRLLVSCLFLFTLLKTFITSDADIISLELFGSKIGAVS